MILEATLPVVAVPIRDHPDFSWGLTRESLKYVYSKYEGKADWFFYANDDTYVFLIFFKLLFYN